MKKHLVLLSLTTILAVTATWASAAGPAVLRIDIPFDFFLEDQLLPAGMYHFQMSYGMAPTASLLRVRSREGAGFFVLTIPGTVSGNPDQSSLRFNKYADKYFLSSVAINNYRADLRERKLEKELKAQIQNAQATILMASK